jgi:hypothetical protein
LKAPAKLALPFTLAILLAFGAYLAFFWHHAEADGTAILDPPKATCGSPTQVSFSWLPIPGATEQHLELSVYDNEFAAGTFTTVDLRPEQTAITLQPIRDDLPNFWRIVGTAPGGDVRTSATSAFMPCYRPILLVGPLQCIDFTSANVTFRWAPLALSGGSQYLEVDLNSDFSGDDLQRYGPLDAARSSYPLSGFQDGTTYYFRVVREGGGQPLISQVGAFTPDCTPVVRSDLYGTDDRLVAPRLGINAPVNMRDVGYDGVLGVPTGAYDVVRYNFPLYPSLTGEPGQDGTMLIGGHVDYYVVGLAVFAPLRNAEVGDVIEYRQGSTKYTYVVDWVTDIPYDSGITDYLDHGTKALLLITCNGTFDKAKYGGYDKRRLVHAVLQTSSPG